MDVLNAVGDMAVAGERGEMGVTRPSVTGDGSERAGLEVVVAVEMVRESLGFAALRSILTLFLVLN